MRGAARLLERCLWAIGFLAVGVWLVVWLNARWWQAQGNRELERRLAETHSTSLSSPSSSGRSSSSPYSAAPAAKLAEGDLIGRIEIPRLDVSSVIFEGDDDGVLRMGVGHLPGSPLPGEAGNVVLAAHRDTFFRALRYIRYRDRIDVVTPAGTRRYQVDLTSIVTPDHTEVLAPTRAATLTLVTCYPFDWFGHAPKRFIVRARELNPPVSANAAARVAKPSMASSNAVMASVDGPSAGATPAARRPAVAPAPRKVSRPQSTDRHHVANTRANGDESATSSELSSKADPESPSEPADSGPTTKPSWNWFVRGLKQLNPAPILAKIAGN